MRQEIYVSDIAKQSGKEVTLRGWVYNSRSSGKIGFVILRDGTGRIQCVCEKSVLGDAGFDIVNRLTQESSIEVTGKVKPEPRAESGFEIQVTALNLISGCENYPISPKEHGTSFLLDNRHLWIRSAKQHAILRIRAEVIRAAREFFDQRGFIGFDAPILTPAACEGTSTLFNVKYFEENAYLTQSGQLYGEAGAMAFGKIYVFGPTFRAEKSKTRKHLTEFWMLEPEVAFMDLNGNMELIEEFVSYVIQSTIKNRATELKTLERNIADLEKIVPPFPRVHYREACEIIKKENPDFVVGGDLGAPDEEILGKKFDKPIFVHRFPKAIKAFYMKEDPEDSELSLSCDLIAPNGYGEICGGSQREENIDVILKKIKEHHLDEKDFQWYLDLRRYGSVPHSGFGMGLERVVSWIAGAEHVRECIPFPRMIYRAYP